MYCINCGVKLGDGEKRCPLCETRVYHPEFKTQTADPLYPADRYPQPQPKSMTAPIILSTAFLLPFLTTLLCDLQINGAVTWSGYVMGALLLGYVILVVPAWFQNPNPAWVVFCDFFAVDLYLFYINHTTQGFWFWGFAFPLVSAVGLILTAEILLLRRFPRNGLFIFGGGAVALGLFMPLLELLINMTFQITRFAAWSFYPLVVLVLLGLMLIFLAVNSAARKALERKFFI